MAPPTTATTLALVATALALGRTGCQAGPGTGLAVQVRVGGPGGPGGWGWASTANCTWKTITQPLDHFASPSGARVFSERYCIYDKFWTAGGGRVARGGHGGAGSAGAGKASRPIFFYTGNESPIEPYVNNTGLMWNLGRKMGALIVFAEHRYEGESLPPLAGVEGCITYGTTAQAIADYVALVAALKEEYAAPDAPVIAFGGSYGGMLAGWSRIVYPHVFTGSIAASAPVRMIMSSDTYNYKGGWEAIGRGLSSAGGASDNCFANFRSAQQLAGFLDKSPYGLEVLNKAARRCVPRHP